MIAKSLVDSFLPFLPMERKHVLLCIRDEIFNRGLQYNEEIVHEILKELPWYPKDTKKYCATGCKQVEAKVKSYYG